MVRTRYAPSPTGAQHVGGLRTALYNYLFARAHGGRFVLRIEDTDRARLVHGAAATIAESLAWLGIEADESPARGGDYGPYTQSERLDLYHRYAEELVAQGSAYWAYDTDEELEEIKARGKGYDGRGKARSKEENERRKEAGIAGAIRFIMPDTGESGWDDMLVGAVSRAHSDLARDPVLLKRDGYPTYHLASVVDDHLMRITHVVRAQEWLSSTPLHILLYNALGWEPPRYAHLPIILGADGKKLSKRHGATSVEELRREGVLAAALCNYIVLLGWSYNDTRERFALAELEKLFSIARVQKSAALFDKEKLYWHNRYYLRQLDDELFVAHLKEHLSPALAACLPQEERACAILCAALKERINTFSEAEEWLSYLIPIAPPPAALLSTKKISANAADAILREMIEWGSEDRSAEEIEAHAREYAAAHTIGPGYAVGLLRSALTSAKSSLPFQVVAATLNWQQIAARFGTARLALAAIV